MQWVDVKAASASAGEAFESVVRCLCMYRIGPPQYMSGSDPCLSSCAISDHEMASFFSTQMVVHHLCVYIEDNEQSMATVAIMAQRADLLDLPEDIESVIIGSRCCKASLDLQRALRVLEHLAASHVCSDTKYEISNDLLMIYDETSTPTKGCVFDAVGEIILKLVLWTSRIQRCRKYALACKPFFPWFKQCTCGG